jgi:DNA-binding transcriptional ArsR family regulator
MDSSCDKNSRFKWLLNGKKRPEILRAIGRNKGEDIEWVAGACNLSLSAMRSHVSRLKRKGYVYTYRNGSDFEIWPTKLGEAFISTDIRTDDTILDTPD